MIWLWKKIHCLCEDSKVARLASELVKEPLRGLFESTIQVCHLLSSRLFNHPFLGSSKKLKRAHTVTLIYIYYIYTYHIIQSYMFSRFDPIRSGTLNIFLGLACSWKLCCEPWPGLPSWGVGTQHDIATIQGLHLSVKDIPSSLNGRVLWSFCTNTLSCEKMHLEAV